VLAAVFGASAAAAQEPESTSRPRILASEISISRGETELRLELAGGDQLRIVTSAGPENRVVRSRVSGEPGSLRQEIELSTTRGGALDRSWRELLERATETPSDNLPELLAGWTAPRGGEEVDRALELMLSGQVQEVSANVPIEAEQLGDSLSRLERRVRELTARLEESQDVPMTARPDRGRRNEFMSPFRHIGRGFAGVMSVLVALAVLFGLGFAIVFFGGRPHLEAVADTARHFTIRSFLVGLAASFLVVPAYILGAIVLTISIVGIPALLVWLPLFPLAVVLAAVLGYLAVAHAAGEAFAERRFYGGQWFTRANSYYYLLTGLGLLLALFIAANIVQMAGPWLGFIHGLLTFFGIMLTWAVFTTGFGAVLITRAGTRPTTTFGEPRRYAEETHV